MSVASARPGWPGWAGCLLRPLAWLYAAGATVHRRVGTRLRPRRARPACAIVSVGALTVGGAGKTPVAAWIAAGLARRGWRVVLASRGYGGATRAAVVVVSDGARVQASAASVGDEPIVLAAHAPGVPVLVGRDRRRVGHHAVSEFAAQILVLDDGFQHHRLARDLDVVCIDATAGLGNGRVLPAGPLREPRASLRHADWLGLIGDEGEPASAVEALAAEFRRDGGVVFGARRRARALVSLDGTRRCAPTGLAGRRVGLVCGIAAPASFRRTVEALGARVVSLRALPDHHAYRPEDLRALDPTLELWLTTEKDATKISPSWPGSTSIWVLSIELEVEDAMGLLGRLEAALQAAGRLASTASRSVSPADSELDAAETGPPATRPDRSTSNRARNRSPRRRASQGQGGTE
ncbi:MAG: tetraacyldisaccharide 4'-kinase [Myxococcota bacterium]